MVDLIKQMVIERARSIWEHAGKRGDFCVQYDNFETSGIMVFGAVNRVRWSLDYGFTLDTIYCTREFIKAFNETLRGVG